MIVFLNGGNRTTIRVDSSTKMVFLPTNQHTLTGDLIISGDIDSVKTNMLIGGTGGSTYARIGYNNFTSTDSVFAFNIYKHIYHQGTVQMFMGSSNSATQVMKIDVYSSNVTAPNGSFVSNSDRKLKDDIQDLDKDICLDILENINAKTYTRNDLNNEKRVGFISNEFDEKLNDDMKNIIGSLKNEEGEHQTTTLDYARLTTILWSVCQNLNERIKVLEAK